MALRRCALDVCSPLRIGAGSSMSRIKYQLVIAINGGSAAHFDMEDNCWFANALFGRELNDTRLCVMRETDSRRADESAVG